MQPASRQQRHLGVYARIIDARRVLLVRKARGPYTGTWDLPGGSMNFGESPADTVRREVLEETGLAVADCRLADVFTHAQRYTEKDGSAVDLHHVAILFDARVAVGELKGTPDGEDSNGAAWHSLDALPTLSPIAAAALGAAE